MKHTLSVTAILLIMFFLTQLFGIYSVAYSMNVAKNPDGSINVTYPDTAVGERPEMKGIESFLYILVSIGIGTGIILLLIKIKKFGIWKVFFFLAVWMSISIILGVYIDPNLSLIIAFILALGKLYSRNIMIFNITEVLMYAGITVLFTPLIEVWYMAALLVIISIYDMIAVWKSKHMITMAKAMTKNNLFAGFSIPYSRKKDKSKKERQVHPKKETKKKKTGDIAILGGGDVAFPLLFSGSVINYLVGSIGVPKLEAFFMTSIIPVLVTIALLILFWKAEKRKFYPAMPFVSAGAFAGFGTILLLVALFF